MPNQFSVDDILEVFKGVLGHLLDVFGQVLLVPPVLLDFAHLDPLHGVGLQHATDQVLAVGWYVWGHLVVALLDLEEKLRQVIVVKGQAAAEHGVKDDTAGPDIDLVARVGLA